MPVLIIILLGLGYLYYDGFLPRQIDASKINGTARLVNWDRVEYSMHPLPLPPDPERRYIVVSLDNYSEYIVRAVSITAIISQPTGEEIVSIWGAPCIAKNLPDLRILSNTHATEQTCIVPLNQEQSRQIAEKGTSSLKLSWGFRKVTGHSQPNRFMKDVVDWVEQWVSYFFGRVNQ